ncbi:MAG TPA: MBOAT family protein [Candidatus Blautia excrementipullorum]|nr:MBOAT family protein [Candidatus Blautia excrementipullorum]
MLFNSYIFILFFLPVTLLGYFGLHRLGWHMMAKLELVLMSFWFYGYFNPSYLWIMGSSICVNYVLSQLFQRKWQMTESRIRLLKKVLLAIGLAFNLGLIFYYKYYDFFVDNLNKAFSTDFHLRHIVLPLGISFFTFQQVSYVIDSYRGQTREYNILDYSLFVTFFPQLVAGPIVLHNEVLPQFADEKNWKMKSRNMAHGIYVFSAGLVKKVIIADTLSKAVTWGYGNVSAGITSMEGILMMFAYAFQIYFDFSGYCDMATGLGYMFNIKIPMNFNSPYKALSVVDFWDRWHLTLTRFLRTYVYFPLGGSRRGTVRTYINIIIVFLVSGLWHGANWTFIFWGFLHGVANALTRMFKKQWNSIHTVLRWIVTFLFVNVTWIFFRADSISQAVTVLKRILGFQNLNVRASMLNQFKLTEFAFIYEKIPGLNDIISSIRGFDALLLMTLALVICLAFKNNQELEFKPTVRRSVTAIIYLVWGIMSLSGVSEFLYFNF